MASSIVPPEINSARMFTGDGAPPMSNAASGWTGLASELSTSASSISQPDVVSAAVAALFAAHAQTYQAVGNATTHVLPEGGEALAVSEEAILVGIGDGTET
jgi:hypothetical protein